MRERQDGVLLRLLSSEQQDVASVRFLAADVLLENLVDNRLHQVLIEYHDGDRLKRDPRLRGHRLLLVLRLVLAQQFEVDS